MAEFKTRIQHKHDTAENWAKATTFSPLNGEIIIYDPDATHSYPRVKIGDGKTNVNTLPFIDDSVSAQINAAINALDIPVVDQKYNPLSTNAQSGAAVAQALANIPTQFSPITDAELDEICVITSSVEERLEGDGQEFYTMAPSTLSFRSTAPLNELQDIQVNGTTVDPSNYTLEEGSTIVNLSHEYLKTLEVGSYELSVVSDSKTAKGDFTVKAPELNERGFYYNQPYFVDDAYIGSGDNIAVLSGAFMVSKDNTLYVLNLNSETLEVATLTYENGYYTFPFAGATLTGSFTSDGKSFITSKTFIAGYGGIIPDYNGTEQVEFAIDSSHIASDSEYLYFVGIGDGLAALPIDKSKGSYAMPKNNINGSAVTRFVNYAFSNNLELVSVSFIPEGFSELYGTFSDCSNLVDVIIPSSVSLIRGAFHSCDQLTNIVFNGTVAQWDAITKDSTWDSGILATYVQCSDGIVNI